MIFLLARVRVISFFSGSGGTGPVAGFEGLVVEVVELSVELELAVVTVVEMLLEVEVLSGSLVSVSEKVAPELQAMVVEIVVVDETWAEVEDEVFVPCSYRTYLVKHVCLCVHVCNHNTPQ